MAYGDRPLAMLLDPQRRGSSPENTQSRYWKLNVTGAWMKLPASLVAAPSAVIAAAPLVYSAVFWMALC
jgi:hypothetical protein